MIKKQIFDGIITKKLPNANFLVKISKLNREVLCYVSGKIRINFIRILLGDPVKIELENFNSIKGRIIYRSKWKYHHQLKKFVTYVK